MAMSHEGRREAAQRPLSEAGEGESEGFELAEQELIEHATHSDEHGTDRILNDALPPERSPGGAGGEADSEHSSETDGDSER